MVMSYVQSKNNAYRHDTTTFNLTVHKKCTAIPIMKTSIKNVKPLQILPVAYQKETPNIAIPKKKVAPTAILVKKAPLKLCTSASLSVFLYLYTCIE